MVRRIVSGSCVLFLGVVCALPVHAYTLTVGDYSFLEPVTDHIEVIASQGDKWRLISLASRLQERSLAYDDTSKIATVLRYLAAYVLWQFEIVVHGTGSLEQYWSQASDDASYEKREDDADLPYSPDIPVATNSPQVTEHELDFYAQYWPEVTSHETTILQTCVQYYDQIDEIARAHDFPTPLIIATRYREHTCHFNNPANGRGNFQITSHYYEPGEITRAQFEEQVVNFINFSRAKRARYDNLLLRDDVSINMTHDAYDLISIQKHAILYNGIKAGTTPATNDYANRNFGNGPDGKDGIVAMFLKVLQREIQNY